MQISKGCGMEFLSARTIWQLVYKENCWCVRLMRRSLQVVVRQKFVLCMLVPLTHIPFLGVEMTD